MLPTGGLIFSMYVTIEKRKFFLGGWASLAGYMPFGKLPSSHIQLARGLCQGVTDLQNIFVLFGMKFRV